VKGSLNGERGLVGVKSTLIKLRLYGEVHQVSQRGEEEKQK
jgi:hypothetical protein